MCNAFGYYWADLCMVKIRTQLHRQKRNQKHIKNDENNKTYTLVTVSTFGVSGTALYEKRVNGNTLVTISLAGTIADEVYPASINLGSIESVGGGPVVKTLNDVEGTIGKSYTNIRKLDSGIDITYDDWLVYDGYINIYQTAVNIDNIISHSNIGSN